MKPWLFISRLRQTVCIFLMASFLLSACVGSSPTEPGYKIRFAFDLWIGYYPVVLAQELGYFADEGVDLEYEVVTSIQSNALMLSGTYDGVGTALGDAVALTQTASAHLAGETRLILASTLSEGGDALVGKAGITPENLMGKRIGVKIGTFSELFVYQLLKKAGLGPKDVTLVDTSAEDVPNWIAQGLIDAGHTWEPYISDALSQGAVIVLDSKQTPGLVVDTVVFRSDFVNQNPKAVQAFTNAWFRAVNYWESNPEESAQIIAQALAIPVADVSLVGVKMLDIFENRALLQEGNSSSSIYFTSTEYANFFVLKGRLSRQPDIQQFIDSRFVTAATP